MDHNLEKNKKIFFSGLRIISLPIPNFKKISEAHNLKTKLKKYISPIPRPNPFFNSELYSKKYLSKSFDSEIEDEDFIQLKPNCYSDRKIFPKSFSKSKIEDEKSTALGEANTHQNNFKKVTFSKIEIIRVENYKKYNKIKKKVNYNLNKSNWVLEEEECLVF